MQAASWHQRGKRVECQWRIPHNYYIISRHVTTPNFAVQIGDYVMLPSSAG